MIKSLAAAIALVTCAGFSARAYAQEGYRVGESNNSAQPDTTAPATKDDNAGPVRMARVSFVSGNVTWRPDGDTDWTSATNNTPMRQGAQVWVGDGGRAEIQFDDGSVLRLGSGAVATLQTLFSDSQGEFTEVKMTDGLASMDLRTDHSIYQIDTPHGSVKSVGPSLVRVGVDDDVEVGVREGSATLDGPQGKLTMHSGDYVDVRDDNTSYEVRPLPAEDSWDKFTLERHDLMTHVDKNLPENMQYMAGDIDQYGNWRDDSQYGKVWVPDEAPEWQPYHDGHWVWVDPFGWTWVGDEPWGWAPYHYGTWIHRPWGWAWVPGPVCQFWSPAVVSFCTYGDDVIWAPLAPWECVYPSAFDVGFFGPRWSIWFSIGGCGCWFPHGEHECWSRHWDNHWVNHWHGWDHDHGHGWDHDIAQHGLGGAEWSHNHFTPINARWGATSASTGAFSGHGKYVAIHGTQAQSVFEKGQTVGVPTHGQPMSGPVKIAQPGPRSWNPTRTGATRPEENTGIINRPTYRGQSRTGLTRVSAPAPLGEHYSSAASAAAAARQSLGWSPRGGSSGFNSPSGRSYDSNQNERGSSRFNGFGNRDTNGFGNRESSGFNGQRMHPGSVDRPSSGLSQRSNGGWTVPDHGGWTHVHSSPPSGMQSPRGGFGGGSPRSQGGGGSSGSSHGGGGGGSSNHGGNGHGGGR